MRCNLLANTEAIIETDALGSSIALKEPSGNQIPNAHASTAATIQKLHTRQYPHPSVVGLAAASIPIALVSASTATYQQYAASAPIMESSLIPKTFLKQAKITKGTNLTKNGPKTPKKRPPKWQNDSK